MSFSLLALGGSRRAAMSPRRRRHTPGGRVPGATGERQRALGEGVRLLQAASQHMRLPQGETTEHLVVSLSVAVLCSSACVSSGTASATRPTRVYAAPKAAAIQGNRREVRVLTEAHGPFEQGERPGQVALAEGQQTDPPEAIMRLAG